MLNKSKSLVRLLLFCFTTISLINYCHAQRQVAHQSKKYINFDHHDVVHSNSQHQQQPQLNRRIHPELTRNTRQLSSLTNNNLAAAASSSDYGYGTGTSPGGTEYGGYASPGGHGGGSSYGHGHGGGGGHGHGKKDCNSALGLLGLLGLVSFLQNVLAQMTTTAAGRKKRDTDTSEEDNNNETTAKSTSINDVDKITLHVMPHLVRIGAVLDATIPLNCSLHAICATNAILVNEISDEGQGRFVGSMISDGIMNMITKKYAKNGNKIHKSMKKEFDEIASAAAIGRKVKSKDDNDNGNCGKMYKECATLPNGSFSHPSLGFMGL